MSKTKTNGTAGAGSGIQITETAEGRLAPVTEVTIGGAASGEVAPSWSSDLGNHWYAVVRPNDAEGVVSPGYMLRGGGQTPRGAVCRAILNERRELVSRAAILATIEAEAGLAGVADAELEAMAAEPGEDATPAAAETGGAA